MRPPVRTPRRLRARAATTALVAATALALVFLAACLQAPNVVAAPTSAPLTGSVTGAASVGTGLNSTYRVTATGGPALAANGTQIGIYSYKASLSGPNITLAQGAILPSTGVLTGGEMNLTLKAPRVAQLVTIYVLVTSSLGTTNVSQNFSYSVNIVQPYVLSANLVVGPTAAVAPFYLTVLLDGNPVGAVKVPGLSAASSYPVSFSYVPSNLAPGWHTFSVSLALEHGLVTFSGGSEVYSASFYVAGPPASNTLWYVTGGAALVGVIFIWSTRVGARRRGRPSK